jgi:hypothetical protein
VSPTLSWIVMALLALLVGLLALAYLSASARLDRRENDLGRMPEAWLERQRRQR